MSKIESAFKKILKIMDLMWPYFILIAAIMFLAQWDGALFGISFFLVPVWVLLYWVSPLIIIYIWKKIRRSKLTVLNVRICTTIELLFFSLSLVRDFFSKYYSSEIHSLCLGTIVAILILHWVLIKHMRKADINVDEDGGD